MTLKEEDASALREQRQTERKRRKPVRNAKKEESKRQCIACGVHKALVRARDERLISISAFLSLRFFINLEQPLGMQE